MALWHIILIAVIQGITEFLPVSSSGHLALLPILTELEDQGLEIDIAVHIGTLFAVVLYFWTDLKAAIFGLMELLTGKVQNTNAVLALKLIVATIPVVLVGGIIAYLDVNDGMRTITVIGWTMLIFGIVLYIADQWGGVTKNSEDWSVRDAFVLGIWQAFALVPGTSRSGATISGARFLGYDRFSAAKIAMLMSVPTILASGAVLALKVATAETQIALGDIFIAAFFAFLSALAALVIMMRLLRSISFTPYVIYRIILGIILLAIAYGVV